MSSFKQLESDCSSELNIYSRRMNYPARMTTDAPDDGWTPHPDAAPLAERLDLTDLDLLAELTHEVRGAIVRRLKEPRTVAELAASMDVPVTRLYHHVHRLDDLGFIQVVATRQVAAVTERRYQAVARSFGVDTEKIDALDHRELAIALGSLFDVAKLGFQRMVEASGPEQLSQEQEAMTTLSLGERFMSPERHRELVRRLDTLLEEFESDREQDDPDALVSSVLIAAWPDTR